MPETIDCDPTALATASRCYCYQPKIADAVIIYLLTQLAQDTSTPAELTAKAECYCFENEKVREGILTYLLCAVINA
jgi:hypothetical protein